MSEETPPVAEERKPEKKPEEEMDELVDKLYKLLSDMSSALEKIATYISSGREAQRGLMEALGKVNSSLEALDAKVEKLSVGLSQTFSAQKTGKYTESGGKTPESSGVGEVVTVSDIDAPGADTLRVQKGEVLKSVVTPRPVVVSRELPKGEPDLNGVIRGVLSGKVKFGELASKVWEVVRK